MPHLAILFANFGPYHIARAKACQHYCSDNRWQFSAIELARADTEYPWEINLSKLPFLLHSVTDKALNQLPFYELLTRLYALLDKLNPDVVAIAGYARPSMLAALSWCHMHRRTAILFSETHEKDTPRVAWRELPKSILLRLYDAALVGGKPQHRYLIKLGMKPESLFSGYNIINNETFNSNQLASLPSPIFPPYFLAINRFIPKKNLFRLIDAYSIYRQHSADPPWHLVLAGDGPLYKKIKNKIQLLELDDVIHLPGFLQQQQLLPYFSHAQCFIHASTHEQWGLVVNEAMAAGLPVIVSQNCGCFEDLVIEGKTGFGFDPTDVAQLSRLMSKISNGSLDLDKMRQESALHMKQFSPDSFAKGLFAAIEYAST